MLSRGELPGVALRKQESLGFPQPPSRLSALSCVLTNSFSYSAPPPRKLKERLQSQLRRVSAGASNFHINSSKLPSTSFCKQLRRERYSSAHVLTATILHRCTAATNQEISVTLSLRGTVWNSILATCAAAAEHSLFRFHTFFRPHSTLVEHQHTRPRSHRIMIPAARQTFSMPMFTLRVQLCDAAWAAVDHQLTGLDYGLASPPFARQRLKRTGQLRALLLPRRPAC